jgi:hypothetical protein
MRCQAQTQQEAADDPFGWMAGDLRLHGGMTDGSAADSAVPGPVRPKPAVATNLSFQGAGPPGLRTKGARDYRMSRLRAVRWCWTVPA